MKNHFKNADEAFVYFYDLIGETGTEFDKTKALFNVGFTIENPEQNIINTSFRDWNRKYAEREWQWYLSGDPDATEIAKKAPIWLKMMDSEAKVRSNYGWQWGRNDQLVKIVALLNPHRSPGKPPYQYMMLKSSIPMAMIRHAHMRSNLQ